jgi:asparagine synthase (glutamine-hydrolysing)
VAPADDAPPLLSSTESRVLATHMGQIVLVVEADRTPQANVRQALATIEAEGSGVLLYLSQEGRGIGLLNKLRLAKGFVASSAMAADERYRSYLQLMPPDTLSRLLLAPAGDAPDALALAFAGAGHEDELNRMLAVDAETQLPDDLLMLTDKMSMAVSLECRVPLLDHELVEMAAAMPVGLKVPGGQLKGLLKQALAELLPQDILHRAKRGFGTPMGAWLKRELAPLLRCLLAPAVVRGRGLFDPAVVSRLVADHEANRIDGTDALLALMNLEIWSRIYLDRRDPADLTDELKRLVDQPALASGATRRWPTREAR